MNGLKDQPLILALDTSSKITSLAISRGRELVESVSTAGDETRSQRLWIDIERLLGKAQLTVTDIDLFAVCTGPGGFTGLRVGIAAVKGFASANNKPVVGVTSLEAIASVAGVSELVCPMTGAYRGEVYCQLFAIDGGGLPIARNEPSVARLEEILQSIPPDAVLNVKESEIGALNGALESAGLSRRVRAVGDSLARYVAELALLKYERGGVQTAADLRACYVRPADATIKLSQGVLGSKIKRTLSRDQIGGSRKP